MKQPFGQSTKTKVDVTFVIDGTESMETCINAVMCAMFMLLDILVKGSLDVLLGLVIFRDETYGEAAECHPVGTPPEDIRSVLKHTEATGGGDEPESSMLAVRHALALSGYREGAKKVMLLITDAPPHDPEAGVTSKQILDDLKREDVLFFACVPNISPYRQFVDSTKGMLFEIGDNLDAKAFSTMLAAFGHATVRTVRGQAGSDMFEAFENAMRLTRR